MKKLDRFFPRYEEFEPMVPAWCATPGLKGCIHRFFDTSPFSPSGRYLAVFQLPFEDRQPEPGEKGEIFVIDLESGRCEQAAESRAWEPQTGANLNWGATDRELFFNDMDVSCWRPFAWKLDFKSGRRKKLRGTVYHASSDGRWLISASLVSMRRTQPGYGAVVPEENIPQNIGPSDDDGFYLTDTHTGEERLLCSIKNLIERAQPPVLIEDAESREIYGFHCKFNQQGSRLMLSLRWFPAGEEPRVNVFSTDFKSVEYAWVTVKPDGSSLHCAVGPEQWRKRGHHATWFPDGKKISMNLKIDGGLMRFVEVNYDGSGLRKMHESLQGSGHPTVVPGGRHILTDAYARESPAFGDGTVPLRWIDLEKGTEKTAVRVNTRQPCQDGVLRVDPHPAWDRTWRYVAFNAFVEGTRKVFIADMSGLLSR